MTKVLHCPGSPPNPKSVSEAVEILESRGVVLVPTETGFCFVGDAYSQAVYEKFFKLRPEHPKAKPFSLLLAGVKDLGTHAVFSTSTFRVAARLLPGPFTFVLESNRATPPLFGGAKRKVVGLRVSRHPIASAVAAAFGRPLLMTSVTDAQEILAAQYYDDPWNDLEDAWWSGAHGIVGYFEGVGCAHLVGAALDDGERYPLLVSTIIDFTHDQPQIVRDGGWDHGNILG